MIILRYAGAGKHTWTRFLARSASTSPRPNLPFPQRQPIWNTESIPYTLSTHIIPATYLRRTPNIQLPAPLADAGLDKTERKAIVKTNEAKLRLLRDQLEDLRTTTLYPKQLWICLNRYVKTSGPRTNGLTLVLGHANGFNKEAGIYSQFLASIDIQPTDMGAYISPPSWFLSSCRRDMGLGSCTARRLCAPQRWAVEFTM